MDAHAVSVLEEAHDVRRRQREAAREALHGSNCKLARKKRYNSQVKSSQSKSRQAAKFVSFP